MSYDITFVRVERGEALDDAYERFCERQEAEAAASAPPSDAERRAWQRIVEAVLEVVPSAVRSDGEAFTQVIDEALGLELTLGGESDTTLSIAYGHEGEDAEAAMSEVLRCVEAVERETGLVAYDPQTGARFRREGEEVGSAIARGARLLDEGRAMLRSAVSERPRRWWQLWR